MPKITDTPPLQITEELKILSDDLAEKIPAKKLDRNILIGTWNIRAFGGLTDEWEAGLDQVPNGICIRCCASSKS